jgi:hypothetical protein
MFRRQVERMVGGLLNGLAGKVYYVHRFYMMQESVERKEVLGQMTKDPEAECSLWPLALEMSRAVTRAPRVERRMERWALVVPELA